MRDDQPQGGIIPAVLKGKAFGDGLGVQRMREAFALQAGQAGKSRHRRPFIHTHRIDDERRAACWCRKLVRQKSTEIGGVLAALGTPEISQHQVIDMIGAACQRLE